MTIFGIFQFFGDLAGLPTSLTGLDPGYTKVVFGFPRIHAFSKEPLYFANYLFIPLGVSLALFFSKNATKGSLSDNSQPLLHRLLDQLRGPWLLPLILLLFVNFFLTLSRGAFIALIPFTLIFCLFYWKRIFTLRNIILGILAVVISLTTVYNILESVSPDALDRFLGHAQLEDVLVKKQGESGFGRLMAFSEAIKAWETSPAFGIGLGNFGPYVAYYPLITPIGGWDIVNNEYLELLAETGYVGSGLVFVILLIILARSVGAYQATTDEYLKAILVGLVAAFTAIFTQYNFFSTLYIIHIWVLFGLIIGVQNIIFSQAKEAS
jgi:O-antigen ligase